MKYSGIDLHSNNCVVTVMGDPLSFLSLLLTSPPGTNSLINHRAVTPHQPVRIELAAGTKQGRVRTQPTLLSLFGVEIQEQDKQPCYCMQCMLQIRFGKVCVPVMFDVVIRRPPCWTSAITPCLPRPQRDTKPRNVHLAHRKIREIRQDHLPVSGNTLSTIFGSKFLA